MCNQAVVASLLPEQLLQVAWVWNLTFLGHQSLPLAPQVRYAIFLRTSLARVPFFPSVLTSLPQMPLFHSVRTSAPSVPCFPDLLTSLQAFMLLLLIRLLFPKHSHLLVRLLH